MSESIFFFPFNHERILHWPSQLQLQRNEVIALMNLLNRLSESVKFVHEMGPSVEMIMEGQISSPSSPSRLWEMIRTFIVKNN